MANEKTRTYRRVDDHDMTLGAYVGSPLDDALAGDADWEATSGTKRQRAAADAPGGAATDPAQKTSKEVDENTDLSKLNRPELDQAAVQRGVTEPEKLPSKKAVLDAIDAVSNQDPRSGS